MLVGLLATFTIALRDGAFPVDRADSTADWMAASAFAHGLDPYGDLRSLSETLSTPYWERYQGIDRVERIPRTPGALIVLYPLAWITPEQARALMLFAGVVATAATFMILWKAEALAPIVVYLGAALAMVSGPARWSQLFVTQSAIVMLCVAVVLVTTKKGDFARTGFALAIAGSLKVFPLVLIVLLLTRKRYRAVVSTVGSLAVLNLTPLLLPHVSLSAMVDAFTVTTQAWIDITPGLPGLIARSTPLGFPILLLIAVLLVVPAVIVVFVKRTSYAAGGAVLLAAALLALPLSWPHYLLSLVPAYVLFTGEDTGTTPLRIVFGVGALFLLPMIPILSHTVGLMAIFAGVIGTAIVTGQSQSTRELHAMIDNTEMAIR